MSKRRFLIVACLVSASLIGASEAFALAPPSGAPTGGPSATAPDITKPLIYFGAGPLVNELNAGTITPSQIAASPNAGNVGFITCLVNFKRGRSNGANDSFFNWNGSVKCNGSLQLSGRAFLVQSASNYVQYGQPYSGVRSSATSGGTITVGGHPSVYVYHDAHFQLQPSQVSDTIVGVAPAPGAPLNGASYCYSTGQSQYGSTGAHCVLYSDRF